MPSFNSHRIVLKNLLRMLQRKDIRMVEVGLGKNGVFPELLNSIPELISEYWGIDPFSPVYATRREIRRYKNDGGDLYYLKTCKAMFRYPQLRIIRAPSPEIAKIFPDKFFDLVFIDADHSYDAVKKDILTWLPHVKHRRFLAGHDYFHREPGVVKAVNEIFGINFMLVKRVWIHQRRV